MRTFVLFIGLLSTAALPGNLLAQWKSEGFRSLRPLQVQPETNSHSDLDELWANLNDLDVEVRPNGSYLGVRLTDLDADRARTLKLGEERGVEVTNVEEGSPAANAGIKPGDVLLNYNGENVLSARQFVRLVQETPQGRRVKIQFWRDSRTETTVVTTGAPKSHFEMPPEFVGLTIPDMKILTVDTPTVVMVWKNSLLGIECESVDSQLAQYFGVRRGVLVRSVGKGSPAEKAGMRAGDVLTAIGDRSIATAHDMSSYVRSEHEPGKPISISLIRDHRPMTLNLMSSDNNQ